MTTTTIQISNTPPEESNYIKTFQPVPEPTSPRRGRPATSMQLHADAIHELYASGVTSYIEISRRIHCERKVVRMVLGPKRQVNWSRKVESIEDALGAENASRMRRYLARIVDIYEICRRTASNSGREMISVDRIMHEINLENRRIGRTE